MRIETSVVRKWIIDKLNDAYCQLNIPYQATSLIGGMRENRMVLDQFQVC